MKIFPLLRLFSLRIGLVLVLLHVTRFFARAGVPIVPVAFTDQLPPGTGPNTAYTTFKTACLNNAGQVFFIANLIGVGVNSDNDTALFFGQPGALQLVAREGSPAPGPGGKIYGRYFTFLGSNDSGIIAFDASSQFSDHPDLYSGTPQLVQRLAQAGDSVPGVPEVMDYVNGVSGGAGGKYNNKLQVDEMGRLLFQAQFQNDQGFSLLRGTPGNVTVLVRDGSQADGFVLHPDYVQTRIAWGNSPELLFQSFVDPPGDGTGIGLFAGAPGQLSLVARDSDQAAGAPPERSRLALISRESEFIRQTGTAFG
jgi:hypothetical protein